MNPNIPDVDEALQREPAPLVSMSLMKSVQEDEENPDSPWAFEGIASDETVDVEGDTILRKALDVSYAAQRGYVNWDHGRGPADQIGYLTACEVLTKSRIAELRKSFPDISDSATVYVRGELYKHVPRAADTNRLLKSATDTHPGPGLSLDGAVARDTKSGGVIKAFVRGVAITPVPAHPFTTARLKKSLEAYNAIAGTGTLPSDLPKEIADLVMQGLQKHVASNKDLSLDEAVLWVLRKKPLWTYELANKFVKYTFQNTGRGA